MTVAELIEILNNHHDPNKRVMLGYDGGYSDIEPDQVQNQLIALDVFVGGYIGPHVEDSDGFHDDAVHIHAITIG